MRYVGESDIPAITTRSVSLSCQRWRELWSLAVPKKRRAYFLRVAKTRGSLIKLNNCANFQQTTLLLPSRPLVSAVACRMLLRHRHPGRDNGSTYHKIKGVEVRIGSEVFFFFFSFSFPSLRIYTSVKHFHVDHDQHLFDLQCKWYSIIFATRGLRLVVIQVPSKHLPAIPHE